MIHKSRFARNMRPSVKPNRREIAFGAIPGPSFRISLSEIRTWSLISIMLSNDRKVFEGRGEIPNDRNVLLAISAFGNDTEMTLPSPRIAKESVSCVTARSENTSTGRCISRFRRHCS